MRATQLLGSAPADEVMQCACGVFPEIRRAWVTVDNNLYLWRFDARGGEHAPPVEYSEEGLPMELAMILGLLVAALGALVFGWFSVRLSGVYLAMLTLAFAQIVWSVIYQWNGFTGGSNGLIGIWPSDWLAGTRHP